MYGVHMAYMVYIWYVWCTYGIYGEYIWVNCNDLTVLPSPGIMICLTEIIPIHGLNLGESL